ncbi:MAG: hypothetical protein ACHQT7_00990 [Candidatus Levyibacteriota bacterium]
MTTLSTEKEVIKMAEQNKSHSGGLLFVFGVLAIAYGVIQYLMVGLGWPAYGAWITGGILLLLVKWLKKSMKGK